MTKAPRRIPRRLHLLRLFARLRGSVRHRVGFDRTVYVEDRFGEYRDYWEKAASAIGASFLPLSDSIWEVGIHGRRARIAGYMVGPDDSVTRRIAGDKLVCYEMARTVGVPVPAHCAFRLESLDRARAMLEGTPAPFVVKPMRDTASALGVTIGVRTVRELEHAAALASLYSPDLLLERMVPGESYRLLYLEGRLLHAVRRRGARVEGNGRQTVHRLVHRRYAGQLALGGHEHEVLRLQGLNPDAVPPKGKHVLIRGTPFGLRHQEPRTVYDEPVTGLISSDLDREVRRVVEAVGSGFAGVDILTVDPGRSLKATGGVFLEINTTPGIHHHYVGPGEGPSVAVAVLRSLLKLEDQEAIAEFVLPDAVRLAPAELNRIYASESS